MDSALIRDARKVVSNGESTLALVHGMVLAFGRNSDGELGLGNSNPSEGEFIPSLVGVKDIAMRGGFAVALSQSGQVWVWGRNDRGQLGLGHRNSVFSPTLVSSLSSIRLIAAGRRHAYVVDGNNRVFAWGANDKAQLGLGFSGADVLTPASHSSALPATNGRAVAAVSGDDHNVVLTEAGRLIVWGDGTQGQTGHGALGIVLAPRQLSVVGALQVAAGDRHTVFRTATDVKAFGDNVFGQLGVGTTQPNRTTASSVPGLTATKFLAAGSRHTVAVMADGSVRVWGDNSARQLGFDSGSSGRLPLSLGVATDPSVADSDLDGLPNQWEALYAAASPTDHSDGDELVNIQEFHRFSNPKSADTDGDLLTDFADSSPWDPTNGSSFLLVPIEGDQQVASVSQLNQLPFTVSVWSSDGLVPQAGVAGFYTVDTVPPLPFAAGAVLPVGEGLAQEVLAVSTDSLGLASARFKQPSLPGFETEVSFIAGVERFTFSTRALLVPPLRFAPLFSPVPLAPGQVDSDSDGIPDLTEQAAGLRTGSGNAAVVLPREGALPVIASLDTPGPVRFLTLTPSPAETPQVTIHHDSTSLTVRVGMTVTFRSWARDSDADLDLHDLNIRNESSGTWNFQPGFAGASLVNGESRSESVRGSSSFREVSAQFSQAGTYRVVFAASDRGADPVGGQYWSHSPEVVFTVTP